MAKDTLVAVTAIVSGSRGDGMKVNMHVGLFLFFWYAKMKWSG
jgi:hypothetical protein